MTPEALALAIRNTQFFTAGRESAIFYPVVLATHLTCIAIFGGMILATNLRLLGFAFTDIGATEMVRALRPWKHAGLAIMLSCGVLLAGARANTYYPNTYFRLKLLLLTLLLVHAAIFRPVYRQAGVLESAGVRGNGRLAAALSLLLWAAVVCAGRWIAYWDSPTAIF